MTMPNFLIIGAGKSGTTALYEHLKQHPQVYVSPVKETNFFALEGEELNFQGPGVQDRINRWSVTDIEGYRDLFAGVRGERAVGEASPLYLYSEKAPQRIHHYVPEAKLIAVLRNPVERAYSAFGHVLRDNREPLSDFSRALKAESRRIEDNWPFLFHYKKVGFYYEQLNRYFDTFDRDQMHVYLYEDLKSGTVDVLQDIFRFLDVDDSLVSDVSTRYNKSGVPKNRALDTFLVRPNVVKNALKPLVPRSLRAKIKTDLRNRNLGGIPPMSPEVRRELIDDYRDDILKLQDLIQRDLSGWLR